MKKLLLSLSLLWICLAAAAQQSGEVPPALTQLVAALNAKSVAPLQPYLTAETRIGTLPAAYTAQVLAQVVPQFGAVESWRVIRQEREGDNTRYVCAITRQGSEKEYSFLLTPAGQFLEINLVQATAKKISTAFGPQELTTPPRVEVPARLVAGLLLVEAEVDGRRGVFILDTGAPALVLHRREFPAPEAQAPLTTGTARGVNGASGTGASYCVVKSFDWAGIRFQSKEVPTLDLANIEQKLGGPVLLGLIGFNLLNQYALTLDYRAGRVLLRKPDASPATPKPAPLLRAPFKLRGHLPVLEVTAGGQPYQLALDCGAQANLLDARYAPLFARKLRKRSQDTLNGVGGAAQPVTSGQLSELRVGGKLRFRRQQTVFADIAHLSQKPDKVALQGIAGYPFLSQYRTTIDYVNQEVRFYKW